MQIIFVFTKSLFYIRLFNIFIISNTSNWIISLYIWNVSISDDRLLNLGLCITRKFWFLQAWYYICYVSLTYTKQIHIQYTNVYYHGSQKLFSQEAIFLFLLFSYFSQTKLHATLFISHPRIHLAFFFYWPN